MNLAVVLAAALVGAGAPVAEGTLSVPRIGEHALNLLSPEVLELSLISEGKSRWDFAAARPADLEVRVDGKSAPIAETGFRRRAVYAPLRKHDLRAGNSLYLVLAQPIAEGANVEVLDPKNELGGSESWRARASPDRLSSAVHVDQLGYAPGAHKLAEVGATLGTLGELPIAARTFSLVTLDGHTVFHGELRPRPDRGFRVSAYQHVLEADFTAFDQIGNYRVDIPGIGRSLPFSINPGEPAALTRTYALGIYHQRCGVALELPFTRFVHTACHTAKAFIPDDDSKSLLWRLRDNEKRSPRQTAPAVTKPSASLYPFIRSGSVDVSGGHHDAGDYGKYVIDSADMIHFLITAVDDFKGVAALDNLGIPESGDGKSDLLQIARREADFLYKMQDDDGAFYSLVQPRDGSYEVNLAPQNGLPQIVFPKNTTVTAAAVAALAQAGSSPKMREQFPEDAARDLAAAKKGWQFLERARAKYGKEGAYQSVHHYGSDFYDDDELAWAAVEMFLATGDAAIKEQVATLNPDVRKWYWVRLPAAYGNAIRSYAFGALSGRRREVELDPSLLQKCQQALLLEANDLVTWSQGSAYGTPLPLAVRQQFRVGWYFSGAQTFEMTAAYQLDPRDQLREAISSAFDYELGNNPVNVSYLSGVGWKRQHELVSQAEHSERQALPPSGIPAGNVQEGISWLGLYKREPIELTVPGDGDPANRYPLYDRWTDAFNLETEPSTAVQSRALASAAFWMARSPLANQPWRAAAARIEGMPAHLHPGVSISLHIQADGLDLSGAQTVWEAAEDDPVFGARATYTPEKKGPTWIEAEAMLPDGRRVFATAEAVVE